MKRKFYKKQELYRPLWAHDLFAFREALGLTQHEMACQMGLTKDKWNRWECGREYPAGRTIKAIETAFSVKIEIARDADGNRRFYFN